MAPEMPSSLIALDLQLQNSRVECQLDRYDVVGRPLYVSWNAIECPENYVPLGNGTAYVWLPDGTMHRKYRARVPEGIDGFEWMDTAIGSGAMFILTLPQSYVLVPPSAGSEMQPPVDCKVTSDGRMAVYWWQEHNRFTVKWQMKAKPSLDMEDECRSMKRAMAQLKLPIVLPVEVDRPPGETSVPSARPATSAVPPEYHYHYYLGDFHEHRERSIQIGDNSVISAPLTIADTIEGSYNTLRKSDVSGDVRDLLEQLLKEVAEVSKKSLQDHPAEAQFLTRDADALVREAASGLPRRKWYELSIGGLKAAAKNIGEIAEPVLSIVERLTSVLLRYN